MQCSAVAGLGVQVVLPAFHAARLDEAQEKEKTR